MFSETLLPVSVFHIDSFFWSKLGPKEGSETSSESIKLTPKNSQKETNFTRRHIVEDSV